MNALKGHYLLLGRLRLIATALLFNFVVVALLSDPSLGCFDFTMFLESGYSCRHYSAENWGWEGLHRSLLEGSQD